MYSKERILHNLHGFWLPFEAGPRELASRRCPVEVASFSFLLVDSGFLRRLTVMAFPRKIRPCPQKKETTCWPSFTATTPSSSTRRWRRPARLRTARTWALFARSRTPCWPWTGTSAQRTSWRWNIATTWGSFSGTLRWRGTWCLPSERGRRSEPRLWPWRRRWKEPGPCPGIGWPTLPSGLTSSRRSTWRRPSWSRHSSSRGPSRGIPTGSSTLRRSSRGMRKRWAKDTRSTSWGLGSEGRPFASGYGGPAKVCRPTWTWASCSSGSRSSPRRWRRFYRKVAKKRRGAWPASWPSTPTRRSGPAAKAWGRSFSGRSWTSSATTCSATLFATRQFSTAAPTPSSSSLSCSESWRMRRSSPPWTCWGGGRRPRPPRATSSQQV